MENNSDYKMLEICYDLMLYRLVAILRSRMNTEVKQHRTWPILR